MDAVISRLQAAKADWAATSWDERSRLLFEISAATAAIAEGWAEASARGKRIPSWSPLAGEEWLTGPYVLISYARKLGSRVRKAATGRAMEGIRLRELPNGQVAAQVFPEKFMDKLILPGTRMDVWMEPHVTRDTLAGHVAGAFRNPPAPRLCVVLGAGNVSSIAPLDCLHKLFFENEVVLLKLNPVNAYLKPYLEAALRPLIDRNVLAIVAGGAEVGEYLCTHPDVETLFITGSQAVHDLIVWGAGEEAARNKAAGTPRNPRPIESELGGVGPTIVVPGPWSKSDIAYHAAHIATQKLQNSGHVCVACQVLILPDGWDTSEALLKAVEQQMKAAPERPAYYPGAASRAAAFGVGAGDQDTGLRAVVTFQPGTAEPFERTEVFGPVLTATRLPAPSPEAFLETAINYANDSLYGTLGANIIVHPKSVMEIGEERFEQLIGQLRYGTIAINTWAGAAFAMPGAAWGAFPGHSLDNAESGIGKVHNAMMFDAAERTVLWAPFRQRPMPPWFVTHRQALKAGRAVTKFEAAKSPLELIKILTASMRA
ncbi:aldehyde dehydrogenase [Roseibium sp. RKSG952]|nr:aldehyde dehydrogenase [Roseibium sp. RKSG952]